MTTPNSNSSAFDSIDLRRYLTDADYNAELHQQYIEGIASAAEAAGREREEKILKIILGD